jgi:hypothetical protein
MNVKVNVWCASVRLICRRMSHLRVEPSVPAVLATGADGLGPAGLPSALPSEAPPERP